MRVSAGTELAFTNSGRRKSQRSDELVKGGDGFWMKTPIHSRHRDPDRDADAGDASVGPALRHMVVKPTDQSGATFEIESVRLVFRKEHLATIASGVTWQGLKEIYREVDCRPRAGNGDVYRHGARARLARSRGRHDRGRSGHVPHQRVREREGRRAARAHDHDATSLGTDGDRSVEVRRTDRDAGVHAGVAGRGDAWILGLAGHPHAIDRPGTRGRRRVGGAGGRVRAASSSFRPTPCAATISCLRLQPRNGADDRDARAAKGRCSRTTPRRRHGRRSPRRR